MALDWAGYKGSERHRLVENRAIERAERGQVDGRRLPGRGISARGGAFAPGWRSLGRRTLRRGTTGGQEGWGAFPPLSRRADGCAVDFTGLLNASYTGLELFLLTLATVFGARMIGIDSGQFTATPVIRKMCSDWSDDAYFRCDFLVVVLFGTFVAYAFAAPATAQHAVAAGLAWTSMVQVGNNVNDRRLGRRRTASNGHGGAGVRPGPAESDQVLKATARPKRPT